MFDQKNYTLVINLLFIFQLLALPFYEVSLIYSGSMMPTMTYPKLYLVANNAAVQHGSVVKTCPWGPLGQSYTKRVIGMPGDKVTICNNQTYINDQCCTIKKVKVGKMLFVTEKIGNKTFTVQYDLSVSNNAELKIKVPQGRILLLGDNRSYSLDSRHYGLIACTMIRGIYRIE